MTPIALSPSDIFQLNDIFAEDSFTCADVDLRATQRVDGCIFIEVWEQPTYSPTEGMRADDAPDHLATITVSSEVITWLAHFS